MIEKQFYQIMFISKEYYLNMGVKVFWDVNTIKIGG